MFGSVKGVRLEKREERGLVRTGTLRRWGIPLNAPDTSGERPKSRSRRRSRAPAGGALILRHSNYRRAMLRRCSLFDIPGRLTTARCIRVPCKGPLTRRSAATSPPRERWCGGEIVPHRLLPLGEKVAEGRMRGPWRGPCSDLRQTRSHPCPPSPPGRGSRRRAHGPCRSAHDADLRSRACARKIPSRRR